MMPILPAGNNRLRQAGFTLVEVLAALLIFGLMAGAVAMNMPPKQDPLHKQGNLLATHIQLAAQSGIIQQQAVGIRFVYNGYEIVRYLNEDWKVLQTVDYNLGVKPHLELTQNAVIIDLKLAEKSGIPPIRYDTTGLGTPFELKLESGASRIVLKGSIDGRVTTEVKP